VAVHPELVDRMREALSPPSGMPDPGVLTSLLDGVHPSDLAAILDELTLPEAEQVFARLDDARAAEALSQVASATSRDLIQTSPPDRVARLLGLLPMDEAAELVAAAGEAGQRALDSLSDIEARDVERLLEYPERPDVS